ncbi:eukaryotic translation initiation factor 2 subunit beta [Trichomonascus vanleenenianus]|uniref:translation initiation factor eIF2 subunit beta n=1 Tax=Trichomonascus vanleenenianus TaxID=2268995 RepID=UPI003EC9886E
MSEEEKQQVVDAVDENEFDLKKKKKKSKKVEDEVEEVTDMMAEFGKKKKKKSKSKKEGEEEETGEEATNGGEFEFKKKKKKSKAAATSAFEKELEEAGVEEGAVAAAPAEEKTTKYSSVNDEGEPDLSYPELLSRFFQVLRENNPDLAGDRAGTKYKIPPPSVMREGNKKSMFANVKEISDRMHRPTEHVIQFLFAELGTSGSIDGSNRLIIKGRFQQKQIETVLRRYIMEYVTCKTCKSVNTTMLKENRLYFLQCNSCGSRRSVSSIKTGYQAIMRRRDLKKKVA